MGAHGIEPCTSSLSEKRSTSELRTLGDIYFMIKRRFKQMEG